jgi:hypothetical protein
MSEFYRAHLDRPTTTAALEAHLVSRAGAVELVDAFHRWVYGFADPAPEPVLFFPARPAGNALQIWVRHRDDGKSEHQEPRTGDVNWLCARVANRGPGVAQHFVVRFRVTAARGPDFVWPRDFLPAMTAAVGFDLAAGQSRLVTADLPVETWPPGDDPVWLLASALTRGGAPATGVRRLRPVRAARYGGAVVRR